MIKKIIEAEFNKDTSTKPKGADAARIQKLKDQGKTREANAAYSRTVRKNAAHNLGNTLPRAAHELPATIAAVKTVMNTPNSMKGKAAIATGAKIAGSLGTNTIKAGYNLGRLIFNHPEWYTKNGNITVNANFGIRKGVKNLGVVQEAMVQGLSANQLVPKSRGTNDAYKDAIHILYAKLRAANSGAKNFDAQDLARYIESTRALLITMSHMAKVLGMLNTLDVYVNGSPKHLFLGISSGFGAGLYDDIVANHANYVNQLNYQIRVMNQITPMIPGLSVYERDMFIFGTIFSDKKGIKGVPTVISPLSLQYTDGTGAYTQGTVGVASGKAILDLINTIQANMQNDPVFGIIAGDILKAYGSAALTKLPEIQLSDGCNVVFDENFNMQLRNAHIGTSGTATTTSGWRTTEVQFDSAIALGDGEIQLVNYDTHPAGDEVYETAVPLAVITDDAYVINSHSDTVSPGQLMSLTRFILSGKDGATTNYLNTCSLGLVTRSLVTYNSVTGSTNANTFKTAYTLAASAAASRVIVGSAQIDNTPGIYLVGPSAADCGWTSDLQTYATVNASELAAYQDVVTLSMYKAPDITEQVNFRASK